MRLNGQRVGTAPAEGPAGSMSQKWIGSYPRGIRFFAGDVAELILFNDALSDRETNRVESYLSDKYKLSLAVSGSERRSPPDSPRKGDGGADVLPVKR